ncbi:Uncharacterised protein [uncultured archaeon]|nr:Uncharacterised protein [uncultured archaeon]
MAKDEPVYEETFNEDLDIDKKISEGGILANVFVEVQGNDSKAAEVALRTTILERLKAEDYVFLLEARIYDILKDEEKEFFTGAAEVKIITRDFRAFMNFIMRYAPTAIEILEPHEIKMGSDEMHALVADVSEMTQIYVSQIVTLMSDPERRKLYEKMLKK